MTLFRTRVFPVLAGALYLWFLALDLTGAGGSMPIKYASILLCAVAALCGPRTRDGRLCALALLLAAAADWFLLVQNAHYDVGVLLFCGVQAVYLMRLYAQRGKVHRWLLPVRLTPLALFGLTDGLNALCAFYFCNLLLNCAESLSLRPRSPKTVLFSCGLVLLTLCDVCVGAYNLGLFLPLSAVGMWLFYLPSQVCVVLSAQEEGENA